MSKPRKFPYTKCPNCGKLVRIRPAVANDWLSSLFPIRHKDEKGKVCEGRWHEVENHEIVEDRPVKMTKPRCYVGQVGKFDEVRIEAGERHDAHEMFARWRFRWWVVSKRLQWLENPPEEIANLAIDALKKKGIIP